jgi:hypothetical protein
VEGEVTLVAKPGPGRDLGQREVVLAPVQQLGPLDAAGDDVPARGRPMEILNSRARW